MRKRSRIRVYIHVRPLIFTSGGGSECQIQQRKISRKVGAQLLASTEKVDKTLRRRKCGKKTKTAPYNHLKSEQLQPDHLAVPTSNVKAQLIWEPTFDEALSQLQ